MKILKIVLKVVAWIYSVVFFILAAGLTPYSLGNLFFLMAGLTIFPPLVSGIKAKLPMVKNWMRYVALILFFIFGAFAMPTSEVEVPGTGDMTIEAVSENEDSPELEYVIPGAKVTPSPTAAPTPTAKPTAEPTPAPTKEPTPTPTAAPTPTPKPTATPTPEPTEKPTPTPEPTKKPTPTPEPTPEPTPTPKPTKKPTPTPEPEEESFTVYVTPTGKRYHLDPDCGGKNSTASTYNRAIARGLTPCKKCA